MKNGVVFRDGNCILSEEEVKKKFDELSLALRTDSMMLQKRLIIRKRFRDQAELNVEKEINIMKTKLNSLLCLRFDAEFLEQLTELKRLLDIISASVTHLAGCAEAYGCVQTEKNISAAVAIITHHVEHIERMKAEICKSPEREKPETKRCLLIMITREQTIKSTFKGQNRSGHGIISLILRHVMQHVLQLLD